MAEPIRPDMASFFAKVGTGHDVEGNNPILITDENSVWYVASGYVDVFAVVMEGENAGTRHKRRYMFSLDEGALLFGFDNDQMLERMGLLLTASVGTKVFRMDRSLFLNERANEQWDNDWLASKVDQWIGSWSTALNVRNSPLEFTLLEPGEEQSLVPDQTWRPMRTVWIKVKDGLVLWGKEHAVTTEDADYIPVTSSGWLETQQAAVVDVKVTQSWLPTDSSLHGLYAFHRLIVSRLAVVVAKERLQEQERLQQRTEHDDSLMDHALKKLIAVTGPDEQQVVSFYSNDPLYPVGKVVGDYAGIVMKPVTRKLKSQSKRSPVQEMAEASGVRSRQVALKGEWWEADNGPLVGYLETSGEPIALIPSGANSYRWENPLHGEKGIVNAEMAAIIQPMAYMFYRPFPARELGIKDLLQFGAHHSVRRDLVMVILLGALAGLLGIMVPLASGILVDTIIPESYRGPLVQMAFILIAVVLSIALFRLAGSLAALRMEGRVENAVQAAIWDRLLNLPVSFFRNYSAGDLASRAGSINAIRQLLSGAVISSLLTGVFSIFQFVLLFRYSPVLALVAGGLVLISMSFTIAIGLLQVRYQRRLLELQGQIAGTVLQLLNGMSKFRMAAAENRAFFLWARAFAEQKKWSYKVRMLDNFSGVFQSFFPLLTSMVLFYLVVSTHSAMSAGQFIAFFAAFTSFLMAMLGMATALLSVVNIVPLYERAKPILKTLPEIHDQLEDPGEVSGAIEIRHIQFRYEEDQALVLNDLSMDIKSGQYVAFVGASGCGKSTLMRLLLGFEQPQSGSIYFDGQDLRSLDISLLRSQFGVVLQNSKLMSGDIFTNITGTSDLTIQDAWEAAAMAGFDDDIRSMPMGMHTVISEGGGTLSGGQRQRLMIARAIAKRPKILFFDEATSALDNRTQRIVSESLGKLQVTRIVIAHRLSTITQADHIYVFDKGRIIQSGTYQELMEQNGLFAELASRQLA
ncbi:NHLP bacteriocin export ABC transporter permease/ATPase subunit [Paenibacillus sp. ClWae2A]|uniref:NHLP bacteriocin export ABC transporter permease/ATPase subunit n=1 Tax=Paenibacillus sp. ClWae2A TaxID=3057177 RepID=UPI0028F6A5CB|nr:NHLP bacteriocin export ABC transporter permease/ATPase subunit [Paenibacillus sp. ClWae2A]MDT9721984.1 NHLP bacteriocin export ABC transporter permease/ATPase subunit [Paenibacillus sp. ClWae2A]